MTGVPGQEAPEGDLSDNELAMVAAMYSDPIIPPCRVCGAALILVSHGPAQPSIWGCFGGDAKGGILGHYEESRFTQRRHADRDVMRLIAEVRRRRQVETGHAGAEPVVDDPRQVPLFDLLDLGGRT